MCRRGDLPRVSWLVRVPALAPDPKPGGSGGEKPRVERGEEQPAVLGSDAQTCPGQVVSS